MLYNVIAVKTATGISKRIDITDTIMQGTIWGCLMCTSPMDTLGKKFYENLETLYEYKGVPFPPLGMVDDAICVTNVSRSKEINNLVKTFIDSKKLRLSEQKCYQIHIGKGHLSCPKLNLHGSEMKVTDSEKYLGDMIDNSGSINATVESRKSKGQGIITGITSIIDEIPLDKHQIDVALKL